MQPLNIYPKPERPSDPSPLEMAIYNYELKAKSFYDEKAKIGNKENAELIRRLNQDFEHLERERKRLISIATIQDSLESYRARNEVLDNEALLAEEYHPTRLRLAKYLTAAGEPRPTLNHEAHHIIPGKGQYIKPAMTSIRVTLHMHGIGINDPMNGLWLHGKIKEKEFDWATAEAVPHRRLHRYNYEQWIFMTLRRPLDKLQFISLLRKVKMQIKMGTMPQQVMMPKNTAWDGVS